jgi:hypothetical protein
MGLDRFNNHRPDLAAVSYVAVDGEDLMAGGVQAVYCLFEQHRVVVSEDYRRAPFGKSPAGARPKPPPAPVTRQLFHQTAPRIVLLRKNCSALLSGS